MDPIATVNQIQSNSGFSASDQITKDQTLIFVGESTPNVMVEIFVDGVAIGTTLSDGAGNWRFEPDPAEGGLEDGIYQITAQATNALNITGAMSTPLEITVDTEFMAAHPTEQINEDTILGRMGTEVAELDGGKFVTSRSYARKWPDAKLDAFIRVRASQFLKEIEHSAGPASVKRNEK